MRCQKESQNGGEVFEIQQAHKLRFLLRFLTWTHEYKHNTTVLLSERKSPAAQHVPNTGVSPTRDWDTPPPGSEVPPRRHLGSVTGVTPPPENTWDQWKYYGMEMGTPPRCGQTDNCENSTFPILPMRAAIMTKVRISLLLLLLFSRQELIHVRIAMFLASRPTTMNPGLPLY